MGYIYLIINLINSKKYVGKTTTTIDERWKEHCQDSLKERCNKRPLYDAFNKYGIENFKIQQLEYIEDDSKLSDREIYWIKELLTYGHNGYNATKGGDGKILYNHNEIIELYNLGYSVTQISEKMGCERSTINKVLKALGIKPRGKSNIINLFDLAGNYIQTFDSAREAALWIIDNKISSGKINSIRGFIRQCCKGDKSFAYGYKWLANTVL